MVEEPDSLVQDFSTSYATWAILNVLLAKPIRFDDRWRPWEQLLREPPSFRVLGDGTAEVGWRFRREFAWHDGTPVTAFDALRTYELLRALPPTYPHAVVVAGIQAMCALDAGALVIRYHPHAPWAPFEEWGTILPTHLLDGVRFSSVEEARAHPLNRSPVANGPYRFVKWVPGSHIVTEAVPMYPLGAPRIRWIVFRFYPTPAALLRAVLTGDVDVTELTGFELAHMREIAACAPDIRTFYTPSMTWEHIDFNLDDPWLADRRVRQALAHAVDRTGLVREVLGAHGIIADSWLPPRHPAFAPDVPVYRYDPVLARGLLGAAGFSMGEDGIFRDSAGRRLVLTLTTHDTARGKFTMTTRRHEMARLIQRDLRRVGVDLRVHLVSSSELAVITAGRTFPHMVMFSWTIAPEANGYLLWHSAQRPDLTDGYGSNLSGWRNAENDRLLDAVVRTGTLIQAAELLRCQQRIWAEDLPALPLFWWPWFTTAKRGLGPVRPVGAFGTYIAWNAHEWSWGAAPLRPSAPWRRGRSVHAQPDPLV